jgi:hypothetical protein
MAGSNEYLKSAGKYLMLKLTGTYTPATPVFDWEGMQARIKAGGAP